MKWPHCHDKAVVRAWVRVSCCSHGVWSGASWMHSRRPAPSERTTAPAMAAGQSRRRKAARRSARLGAGIPSGRWLGQAGHPSGIKSQHGERFHRLLAPRGRGGRGVLVGAAHEAASSTTTAVGCADCAMTDPPQCRCPRMAATRAGRCGRLHWPSRRGDRRLQAGPMWAAVRRRLAGGSGARLLEGSSMPSSAPGTAGVFPIAPTRVSCKLAGSF